MFARKLRALHYPHADSSDPTSQLRASAAHEPQFRSLVVWLELHKIRCLLPEQRQPLKDTAAAQWPHALALYLAQLFPSPSQAALVSSASPVVVADALLRHAIAVEYSDGAEQHNARAKQSAPLVSTALQRRAQQLPAYSEADIRAGLVALASQLRLPDPDTFQPPLSTGELLTSLRSLLALHLTLPAAAAQPPLPPPEALSFVRQLPVSPEDQKALEGSEDGVAVLARVLRLLSVWRLRAAQDGVTECLHGVQSQLRVGRRAGRVDMKKGEVGR